MTSDAENTEEPDIQDQGEPAAFTNWILIILGLPKIGGPLAFLLAFVPFFALLVVFVLAAEAVGFSSDTASVAAIVVGIPLTYMWLRFLEAKAGVMLCLPIPLINIPIRWALIALVIGFVLIGLVGLVVGI
jgi:hypothetical protein